MNYRPYCIPCFLRRTLHAAEIATSDEWLHRKILGEIMAEVGQAEVELSPAEVVHRIFRKTARTLGMPDPYSEEKRRWREEILANAGWIRDRLAGAADPLFAALKASIAANRLDNELRTPVTLKGLMEGLEEMSFEPETYDAFLEAVRGAKKVLYIHDSAGELFFDRLLLERMEKPREAVTSVVRQAPTITDATHEDALAMGLLEVAGEVIDPGIDCQGVPLAECSEDFRRRFDASDLVVVKGQAGYQTLEGQGASAQGVEKDVFCLLSVKCPVMANQLGASLGELVLERI